MSKVDYWTHKNGLLKIEGWARRGLTDAQIVKNMGISKQTFYNWRRKHPEITIALESGRVPLEVELENTLVKKALGYVEEEAEHVEEMIEKDGVVTRRMRNVRKVYAPDTGALIFLLKNRMREYYQDKPKTALEQEQLKLNNEHQELKNDLLKRVIADQGDGLDLVQKLIADIDNEVIEEAEEVLEGSEEEVERKDGGS